MYTNVNSYSQQPPVATGFPLSTAEQFYPSAARTFDIQSRGTLKWSSRLCGCAEDPGNCITTCFCPCFTFGQIAEIVDNGSSSCGASGALYFLVAVLTGCNCLYSCFYRTKMRRQYLLVEDPCNDCLVHCCCEPCALCQEYRELKGRGFDMDIGWHANMERREQGKVVVPPFVEEGMTR